VNFLECSLSLEVHTTGICLCLCDGIRLGFEGLEETVDGLDLVDLVSQRCDCVVVGLCSSQAVVFKVLL